MKILELSAKLFVILTMTTGLSSLAMAEDTGFYVEIDGGQSTAQESRTSLDETATALRIAAGYQMTPWLAVDVGYVDFGNYDGELSVEGVGAFPFTASASGMEMGLVGTIPLGEKFAVTARLEQFWWDSEVKALGETSDDSGNSLAFGAGLQFDISERLTLTGSWQQFELRDTDVDLLSLGVRFNF